MYKASVEEHSCISTAFYLLLGFLWVFLLSLQILISSKQDFGSQNESSNSRTRDKDGAMIVQLTDQ